jgi:hypothetical protein
MREFGGLVSIADGSGQTSAQAPFTIYPAPRDELVDESGRVFLVGPIQLYAGVNIDEALCSFDRYLALIISAMWRR